MRCRRDAGIGAIPNHRQRHGTARRGDTKQKEAIPMSRGWGTQRNVIREDSRQEWNNRMGPLYISLPECVRPSMIRCIRIRH